MLKIIGLVIMLSQPRGPVVRVGDDLYVVDGHAVQTDGCTVMPQWMFAAVEPDGWLAFSGPEGEGVEDRCRLAGFVRRYR